MRVAIAARQLHQAQPVAMWVEPHRLGIDGDDRPQHKALRQVVPVKVDGGVRHELCDAHENFGAQKKQSKRRKMRLRCSGYFSVAGLYRTLYVKYVQSTSWCSCMASIPMADGRRSAKPASAVFPARLIPGRRRSPG